MSREITGNTLPVQPKRRVALDQTHERAAASVQTESKQPTEVSRSLSPVRSVSFHRSQTLAIDAGCQIKSRLWHFASGVTRVAA
jgi:hypothetical protein